jgi:hypothetical protein
MPVMFLFFVLPPPAAWAILFTFVPGRPPRDRSQGLFDQRKAQ